MSFVDEIKMFTIKLLIAMVIIGTFTLVGTIFASTLLVRALQPTLTDARGQANMLVAQVENMSPEQAEKARKRVAAFVQKAQPVIKELAPIIEELRPLFASAACSSSVPADATPPPSQK